MPYAYIRPIDPPGALAFVEIIEIGLTPGVPPRPTPGPTPPIEPPIPPEVPEGHLVYLFAPPEGETPPAAPSANAEVVKVKHSDGGTSWGWIDPHAGPSK